MLLVRCGVPAIFNVAMRRDAKVTLHRFVDYFNGFERVGAVRELFGDETESVLNDLRVEFVSRGGYMGVSDEDGHLIVSARYLRDGDERDIYLDIIHELVHVKQFRSGVELHDGRFGYTDRPTEIEAYVHAVKEARRIGMTEKEIYEYLRMERMSEEDVKRLAAALNVKP